MGVGVGYGGRDSIKTCKDVCMITVGVPCVSVLLAMTYCLTISVCEFHTFY